MAIYDPNSNQHSDGSDIVSHQPCYYDVHVFITRHDGYSIPVKITSDKILTDDDVIKYCVENDLFSEQGDENHVDYVTEIDKDEYNDMKN